MGSRGERIITLLTERGELTVREMAETFGVAEMTIRRDLDRLGQEGRLVRTHGGAILSRPSIVEFAFHTRAETHAAEKRAIAAEAAKLIARGMSVSIDTGTTTLEVAKALRRIRSLKVLTPSLAVASALYACEGVELILLGGIARKGSPDLQGAITEDNIARFAVDAAILGADAVGRKGIYTADTTVSRVSRALIENASTRILVADSSKIDRLSFCKFADWEDIDVLVTDSNASTEAIRWLAHKAKKVVYAGA